jgi:predicted small secreted protein
MGGPAMNTLRWLRSLVLGLVLAPVLLVTVSLMAQTKVSVTDIMTNIDKYHRKLVNVTGTVTEYQERCSKQGNRHTVFKLQDGGQSVAIYSHSTLGLSNGMKVNVEGPFWKVKKVGEYTFYNEIEAASVNPIR